MSLCPLLQIKVSEFGGLKWFAYIHTPANSSYLDPLFRPTHYFIMGWGTWHEPLKWLVWIRAQGPWCLPSQVLVSLILVSSALLHTVSCLSTSHLFLTVLEAGWSKIEVPVCSIWWGSLPALQMALRSERKRDVFPLFL